MSAHVLISGSIFKRPEQRVSKTGKSYVTSTAKIAVGAELQFWNIVAFRDLACAELLRLDEGDAIAAQGALKVGQYPRDGETRISYSVTADYVLALRQPPTQREKKEKVAQVAPPVASAPAFDDGVPF